MEMLEGLVALLFIGNLLALLFVGPLQISAMRRFLRRLKETHPKEWEQIGAPILAINDRSASTSKFIDYVIKRRYVTIGDTELDGLGDKARTLLISSLVLIGIIFICCFAVMIFH